MLTTNRGTLQHPQFRECVDELSKFVPNSQRIIDGAIWEIERDPTGCGIHIKELDVWQARITFPKLSEILLIYCHNRRFVTLLTILY
jgi:hypothetical protein